MFTPSASMCIALEYGMYATNARASSACSHQNTGYPSCAADCESPRESQPFASAHETGDHFSWSGNPVPRMRTLSSSSPVQRMASRPPANSQSPRTNCLRLYPFSGCWARE